MILSKEFNYMTKSINGNRQIRTYLTKQMELFYNETQDKTEALTKYYNFFEEFIRDKNNPFSKLVLGLCFADACRILHFFDICNRLSEEKQEWLKRFDQFTDFSELEDLLEEDPGYMSMMMQAPLKIQLFSSITQAEMLLLSQSVTQHFDFFHEFEKQEMFQDRNLESIQKTYEHNYRIGIATQDSIHIAFEQLIILSMGNINCFYKTLALLLKEYYKTIKVIENNDYSVLSDLEKNLIVKIENCSFEELLYAVAYDDSLIWDILSAYLPLSHILEKDIIESIYEARVPEHVKKKLKEV